MSLLLSDEYGLLENATVWSLIGFAAGKPLYSGPTVIRVVWDDSASIELMSDMKNLGLRAFIYSYTEFEVGSYIYKGVSAQLSPLQQTLAREVKSKNNMKMIMENLQRSYEYGIN